MKRPFLVKAAVMALVAAYFSLGPDAHAILATPSSWGVIQGDFQSGNPNTWLSGNNNADRSGAGGVSGDQRVNQPVWGFALPSIGAGMQIDAVDFGFTMFSTAVNSGATHTAVISLMNHDDIGDFNGADYVTSVSSLGNGTLVATFDNTDVANNSVESFSLAGAALTQFQSLYDASGNPSQTDVWFRISYDNFIWDWGTGGNANDRYQFLDDGSGNVTRTLEITTSVAVPEASLFMLWGLATVGVVALRRRRRTA